MTTVYMVCNPSLVVSCNISAWFCICDVPVEVIRGKMKKGRLLAVTKDLGIFSATDHSPVWDYGLRRQCSSS